MHTRKPTLEQIFQEFFFYIPYSIADTVENNYFEMMGTCLTAKIDRPWEGAPVKSMDPQLVFHKNRWTLGWKIFNPPVPMDLGMGKLFTFMDPQNNP